MTTFDLRESIIPFSLLQISNHFKRMKSGEVVDIICPDATVEKDLQCILPRREYEIFLLDQAVSEINGFFIRLLKK
jgi:TusA-related sulfurtransferase